MSLMDQTITIVRRSESGTTDDYGNALDSISASNVQGSLQQVRRTEPGDAGELSVTEWKLFLPTGTAIDTSDTAIVNGDEYEVVGDPWDANVGSGAVRHVEATVKKTASGEDISSPFPSSTLLPSPTLYP